jgi:hypothetical protein|tara:strand:+ start:567 stop:824 length:258 start_codon:yes stop_codon:yes gene_type:complete
MTVKNTYGNEVVDIEYLAEDLDGLIEKYMPKGWVSENNALFFDDEDIIEDYDRALRVLVRLIAQVQNIDEEELQDRSPISMERGK